MFYSADYFFAPLEFLGCADDDVFGNPNVLEGGAQFQLFPPLGVLHVHDNQQIHIAARPRVSAGM
jgi:hypothetical protein